MIGILLALQVNNWNEERKDRKAEKIALINLKLEFQKNQERINILIERTKVQVADGRAYLELISNDAIPLSEKISLKTPNTNTATWGASNAVLNSLLSSGAIENIKNDSLKYLLNFWPNLIDRFTKAEDRFHYTMKKWQDYENTKKYRSVVKEGDYSIVWPGNYYPNNLDQKNKKLRSELVNDMLYFNLISDFTGSAYVLLINGTLVNENSRLILKLIEKEIEKRNIETNTK
jgi:hypothetical protein